MAAAAHTGHRFCQGEEEVWRVRWMVGAERVGECLAKQGCTCSQCPLAMAWQPNHYTHPRTHPPTPLHPPPTWPKQRRRDRENSQGGSLAAMSAEKHISLPAGVAQREQLALSEQLAALSISQPGQGGEGLGVGASSSSSEVACTREREGKV